MLYAPCSYANPSVDVPIDHWSYDAIEKLAIVGLSDPCDIGFRPYSRIKMAYTIKRALERANEYEAEFDIYEQEYLEELLYNLTEEFREELITIGYDIASDREGGAKKIIFECPELEVEKIYARVNADRAMLENNDGWDIKDGFNLRAKLVSWIKAWNFFALSIVPSFRYSDGDKSINFENLHIRLAHPSFNIELSCGRSSIWWGPGFRGGLLYSNNAFPLDTVKINNIYPFRLPSILKKIGKFNAQFLVSRLEEKRTVPRAYLCSWRLDYTPWDFLKIGFAHSLMFGGKGVKDLGFANFWSSASLVFSAAGGGTEKENHLIAGDIQLFIRRIDRIFPIATGAKLYTEWGAEDESRSIPIKLASTTGVYFTDVFKIPGFDTKLEFTKLDKIWYTHFTYRSGYTHKGNFIGHHLGGDSEEIALTSIFSFPDKYKMALTVARMRRGLHASSIETINQIKLEISLQDALNMYKISNVHMDIFYELDRLENYGGTNKQANNHIIGIKARRKF